MPKSIEEIAREEGMLPPPLGEPDIDATLPNTLRFKWDQPTPLRIRAEQIWKDRQGIHCWLTFHTHDNGTIYGPTRVNLQSASAIASLRRDTNRCDLRAKTRATMARLALREGWACFNHVCRRGIG